MFFATQVALSWRRVFPYAPLLLVLLISGCQTPPKKEILPALDPRVQAEKFHTDRLQRLQRLQRWQVSGVLEVSGEQGRRRVRTEIQGESTRRVKVTIFGLMQQVVSVLYAGSEEIRLVDAEKQQIVEVPASAEGLHYLLGIGLHPEELFEAWVALAGELLEPEAGVANGWLARTGERLLLDPESGLLRQRSGQNEAGGIYRVEYQWPEGSDLPLPMPSEIKVELTPGETQIKFSARQWQIIAQPFAEQWFSALDAYPGFTVSRPLVER
ncbi:MAG: hypothetical protein H7836_11145 [Magnetococcus sp. YQC-3]